MCRVQLKERRHKASESISELGYASAPGAGGKGLYRLQSNNGIKTINLPSRAEILTHGNVLQDDIRIPVNTCLVDPLASEPPKGFITARTIVSPQETVTVRLLHVGEEDKIIYPGTLIGQLSEVKVVESSEEDMKGPSKKLRPDLVEMLKKTKCSRRRLTN